MIHIGDTVGFSVQMPGRVEAYRGVVTGYSRAHRGPVVRITSAGPSHDHPAILPNTALLSFHELN